MVTSCLLPFYISSSSSSSSSSCFKWVVGFFFWWSSSCWLCCWSKHLLLLTISCVVLSDCCCYSKFIYWLHACMLFKFYIFSLSISLFCNISTMKRLLLKSQLHIHNNNKNNNNSNSHENFYVVVLFKFRCFLIQTKYLVIRSKLWHYCCHKLKVVCFFFSFNISYSLLYCYSCCC